MSVTQEARSRASAELGLDHRAGLGEFEQERLLAGVQADRGQQRRSK